MQYIVKYVDLGQEINYLEIKLNKKTIILINKRFYQK